MNNKFFYCVFVMCIYCKSASSMTQLNCTLLIKIPHWLALKHKEYVKFAAANLTSMGEMYKLYALEYDIGAKMDDSADHAFWAEEFNNDTLASSSYFKELYKQRSKAIYDKQPIQELYDSESDNMYITDIDKQFITKNISFPEDYGIETTCDIDEDTLIHDVYLWAKGEIPIFFNLTHETHKDERLANIRRAMAVLEYMTCIKFTELASLNNAKAHYIEVTDASDGCWSHVGKYPALQSTVWDEKHNRYLSYQQINLELRCSHHGVIIHEFMHALGIQHEHQRFDRDIYLNVNMSNIAPENKNAFTKLFNVRLPKTPFRYDSVMHYPSYFMAINQTAGSMVRKISNTDIQYSSTQGIATVTDFNRINYMYGCTKEDTKDKIEM